MLPQIYSKNPENIKSYSYLYMNIYNSYDVVFIAILRLWMNFDIKQICLIRFKFIEQQLVMLSVHFECSIIHFYWKS